MKTVPLCEILTDEQFKEVRRIIKDHRRDDVAMAKALKEYLGQYRAELEAKGVVPDYLAYFLAGVTSYENTSTN